MTLSICISTYKRAELLKKLLDSLLVQKNIEDYLIEIIVVENDMGKNALPVIESFYKKINDHPNFSIKYDVQPIKNISLTRNKTVELANGDFIFFIDDDEYADEFWIFNHLANLQKFNADAGFGWVKSYFEDNIPSVIKGCSVFNRTIDLSGTSTSNLNTGNCVIKKHLLKIIEPPFDPDFGITGGEDYDFFQKLILKGYKLINCKEAITYEFVPKTRANFSWLFKRVFRTGNSYARTYIKRKGGFSIYSAILQFFKGLIQAIIALSISIFTIFLPSISFEWFLKFISNISKPLGVLGFKVKEY